MILQPAVFVLLLLPVYSSNMKIHGHEMPADYKYGTAGLGDENLAKLQAGETVTIQQLKTGRVWEVGELVQIPTADGGSLWARVISRREGFDEVGDSVWDTKIKLAGD